MQNTQDLINYMRGMARTNPAMAQTIAEFDGWQALATALLTQTPLAWLQALPADTLAAIASGQAQPAAAARAALD